eukprot:9480543-Pyramimonas_sp.AAC.3
MFGEGVVNDAVAVVLAQSISKMGSDGTSRTHAPPSHPACDSVDVKGNSVDVTGNSVDVKGNSVDVTGNSVDVTGSSVDDKGNNVDIKGKSADVTGNRVDVKGVCDVRRRRYQHVNGGDSSPVRGLPLPGQRGGGRAVRVPHRLPDPPPLHPPAATVPRLRGAYLIRRLFTLPRQQSPAY